ncbi:MAG: hypothetical protein ACRDKS_04530 [Actinomycetota bacterium]
MIAASGILVVVAFITLIVGVFRTGLELIWTSIAASILAAIFLALGVVQGNKRCVATAGAPVPMPSWSDQPAVGATTTAVMERVPARAEPEEEELPTLVAVPEPEPEIAYAPEPARTPSRKPAAKKPAAAGATAGTVVVIPDRDKFHKATCRYAKNPAAMSMTKAAAKRQGYKPCASCKP